MEDVLKRMEHQFVGVGRHELSRIHQLLLRVRAFHCLSAVDHSSSTSAASAADFAHLSTAFLDLLNAVNELVNCRYFAFVRSLGFILHK